jgi:hypothetical protein
MYLGEETTLRRRSVRCANKQAIFFNQHCVFIWEGIVSQEMYDWISRHINRGTGDEDALVSKAPSYSTGVHRKQDDPDS